MDASYLDRTIGPDPAFYPIDMAPKDGTEIVGWAKKRFEGPGEPPTDYGRWRPFIIRWANDWPGGECYWQMKVPGFTTKVLAEFYTPLLVPRDTQIPVARNKGEETDHAQSDR